MSITYTRAGWRWLACTGAGGEGVDVGAGVHGRAGEAAGAGGEGVDVGAGVLGRRGEAVGAGCEGVARMWIGYEDVDSLITYPDVHNLSGCR